MYKIVSIVTTIFIILSLCACGTKANVEEPNPEIAERDKAIEEAVKKRQEEIAEQKAKSTPIPKAPAGSVPIPETTATPASQEQESMVLYDENGIFIEFRGLIDYYNSSAIVNLYFENNTKDDLYIMQNDLICNRVNLRSTNGTLNLPSDSVFLSYPNFSFVINYDDLKEYGVTEIKTIDFELEINKGSWFGGENIVTIPVHIDGSFPIS